MDVNEGLKDAAWRTVWMIFGLGKEMMGTSWSWRGEERHGTEFIGEHMKELHGAVNHGERDTIGGGRLALKGQYYT